MKSAVISLKGHQYVVKEGDDITIDFVGLSKGKKISPEKILTIYEDDMVILEPKKLSDWQVELEVLESKKGKKIRVFKYKSKSRYRRTKGFRPQQSTLKVIKIIEKNGKN